MSRTDIDSSSGIDLESRTNLYIPSRVLDSKTLVDSDHFESSDEEFDNESDDSDRSWPDTELPGMDSAVPFLFPQSYCFRGFLFIFFWVTLVPKMMMR